LPAVEEVCARDDVRTTPSALRKYIQRNKNEPFFKELEQGKIRLFKTSQKQVFADIEEYSFMRYLWWHQSLDRPFSISRFAEYLESYRYETQGVPKSDWNAVKWAYHLLKRRENCLCLRTPQDLSSSRASTKTKETIFVYADYLDHIKDDQKIFQAWNEDDLFNTDELRVVQKGSKTKVISMRGVRKVDSETLREHAVCSLLPFFNARGKCAMVAIIWPLVEGAERADARVLLDMTEERLASGGRRATRSLEPLHVVHLFRKKGVLDGATFQAVMEAFRSRLALIQPGRHVTVIMDNAAFHVAEEHKVIRELAQVKNGIGK